MSSNTATLVGRMRHYAKHPGCSRALNAACAEAADTLSALAKELEEARSEIREVREECKSLWDQGMRHVAVAVEERARAESATRERDEALAALKASEAREAEAVRDKARLDFLDACNASLNGRYGTNYGWSLVLTHNVTRLMLGRSMEVDLHDSEGGNAKLPSCRDAIDREIARIDVKRRARAVLSTKEMGR